MLATMVRLFPLVIAASTLLGCYSNWNSFNKRAAKLACVHMEECDKAVFEEAYDSLSDCQEQVKPWYDVASDLCEEEDYDGKSGRKCIREAYRERKQCSDDGEEEEEDNDDACAEVHADCSGSDDVELREATEALPPKVLDHMPGFSPELVSR